MHLVAGFCWLFFWKVRCDWGKIDFFWRFNVAEVRRKARWCSSAGNLFLAEALLRACSNLWKSRMRLKDWICPWDYHPFTATCHGGTIPKCKIHSLWPPLCVKLGSESPSDVVFVGKVVTVPSKCKQNYIFRAPFQNTLTNVAYILGTSPPW